MMKMMMTKFIEKWRDTTKSNYDLKGILKKIKLPTIFEQLCYFHEVENPEPY